MQIYFNPLNTACKSIQGGIFAREKLQLNIFHLNREEEYQPVDVKTGEFFGACPALSDCSAPQNNAYLRLNRDGELTEFFPMEITPFGWSITFSIEETGLYYYSFYVDDVGHITCAYPEIGKISDTGHVNGFLLTVSAQEYRTPEWFKGGVMYQIFPDRFCKKGAMPDIKGRVRRDDWGGLPEYRPNAQGRVLNNDFFGGNFKGIQSKLPYLQKLGVTVLYLNPIFEAASNHRYDTSDYKKIDPFLGTEKDFSDLVNAAKEKGIRIILDGVFNHTGDDSVYFNKYGHYPSLGAYQSQDSPYYSWYSFHRHPMHYNSWWGIDTLPEVNERSESYQKFIFDKGGVLKKWLEFGIGGYRLDVADELPDFFLKKLRASVKEENPDAIIIGEVWEDASNKIAYSTRREYLQGYELDSVMNYPLKEGIIRYILSGSAVGLLHTIRVLIDHYPKQTLDCLMNILGTHDTSRILTVLGGIWCNNKDEMAEESANLTPQNKQIAIEKLKMAAVLQYTLPGVPCIYYGDENGMEGHIDPFCRKCFDWEHLNADLLGFYQSLGAMREKYRDVFKDGAFEEIKVLQGLLYFKRKKENREIYIYVNNSQTPYLLQTADKHIDCLTEEVLDGDIAVAPNSYKIFTKA